MKMTMNDAQWALLSKRERTELTVIRKDMAGTPMPENLNPLAKEIADSTQGGNRESIDDLQVQLTNSCRKGSDCTRFHT